MQKFIRYNQNADFENISQLSLKPKEKQLLQAAFLLRHKYLEGYKKTKEGLILYNLLSNTLEHKIANLEKTLKKTPKTLKERLADLQTILLLEKTDKKIKARIKDLELINAL
jgi:hypothetical protein